jgi:hypothetical protein
MVAATEFNWLVMGDPVNQAMFRADYVLSQAERRSTISLCPPEERA